MYNRRQRDGNKTKRKDFKELLKVFTDVHHYDAAAAGLLRLMKEAERNDTGSK